MQKVNLFDSGKGYCKYPLWFAVSAWLVTKPATKWSAYA